MFDTELTRDYEAATSLGLSLRFFYEAGVAGALCDETTKERLRGIGGRYDWSAAEPAVQQTFNGPPREG